MATKSDVIAASMRDVGDRTSDDAVVALYRTWFDNALDWVLSRWAWPYRRGTGTIDITAANFESVALPAEVDEVRYLRDSSTRRPITYLEYDRLLEAEVDLTETGHPVHWYLASYDTDDNVQMIGLWPLPSDDMILQYDANLQVPLPLSDGAAVPVPREVIGILHEAIRGYAYENESQLTIANNCWARAHDRLNKMVSTKGASRPEKKRGLRADGDLRGLSSGFHREIGTIPDPDA